MNRFALVCIVLLGACAGASKQEPEKVSLTFQAQLDSGNAAYRRAEYERSAEFYYLATKTEPDNLVGWYGVYMAESKLGNTEAAAKARALVEQHAPDMPITTHDSATAKGANPHE